MPSGVQPVYLGYRAASAVARALPDRAVEPVSRMTGRAAARRLASRRLMVERNLRRVLGDDLAGADLDRRVDAAFASYAHYWAESFRLPGTRPEVLEARMAEVGFDGVRNALEGGRGAILALPHLGAWEWAAFWITACRGVEVSAVVEQIEPPELATWFTRLRREFGIEVIPFGPDAAVASMKVLRAGRTLVLLCDRDLSGSGVEVEFFGERTTLPGGPATLALRSGAPLIPATCYFDIGGGHLGVALDPLDTERRGKLRDDVARVTQDLAHAFEDLIRRAPEQWHLLQPNWPSDHEALAAAGLSPD